MIKEAQLTEELGISRTPIREALTILEEERFIRIVPKKGIYVTGITLNDVIQIFTVRKEIEPVALRMAAPSLPYDTLIEFHQLISKEPTDLSDAYKLDMAMHMFIVEHCGNQFIIDMMRSVLDHNERIIIASKQNKTKIHDARQEHLAILDMLLEDEYERASDMMRIHIESCRRAAMEYLSNFQSGMLKPTDSYRQILSRITDK